MSGTVRDGRSRSPRPSAGPRSDKALLFHGGCIVTCVPGTKPPQPPVLEAYEWMLVLDGRVQSLGKGPYCARQPQDVLKIDLDGRLVLPGLFDSHCHVFYQGKMQESLVLEGTKSIDELQRKLREYHAQFPDKPVIEGNQWNQDELGRWPTKADLDVVPVPVMLYRRCWHICCANSAALAACGIKGGELIDGGAVDVDEHGAATGILRESAMDKFLGPLKTAGTEEQHRQLLRQGMSVFLRLGCTSVLTNDGMQIGGVKDPWERYGELAKNSSLPLRVFLTVDWKDIDRDLGAPIPSATDNFTVFRVKLWTDGALGASTAALEEPYSDDPAGENRGILQIDQETIQRAVGLAQANGFGVEAHTIGDRSARELLDAFEAKGVTPADRYTLTHCQILSPTLIEKMARLGVVASIQPQFATSDAEIVALRLGQDTERFRNSYAWRSLREAGICLAGGSDAPVEVPNPIMGICCAMENDVHSTENVDFARALEMYTLGGAYAARRESDLGALHPGYHADFIITSLKGCNQVSDITLDGLRKSHVAEVWVGGVSQYSAELDDAALSPPDSTVAPNGPGKSGLLSWVRGPCPCCGPRTPGWSLVRSYSGGN